LKVVAADASRKYGADNPTFTGALTGVKNGDAVSDSYTTSATPASGVGTYAIVAHVTGSAAVLANYEDPERVNGVLTVDPAPLKVVAADASRKYGADDPTFTGSLTGVRNGDAVTASYDTPATATSNVGTYAINAHVHGTAAVLANYDAPVLVEGTLTVEKAPLKAKADDASRKYGADDPVFTGSLSGVKNGDAVTASYDTPATATSNVGTYPINAHVHGAAAVLANYDDTPELVDGTLTIEKAPLNAKADDASRKYGVANPAFTGSLSGVKNGDAVSDSYTTSATPASGVGTYPIHAHVDGTAAVLANYEAPVAVDGTLTIEKAPLKAKADDASRKYGVANPTFTGTLTGVKNGDAITDSYTSVATTTSNVGTYPINAHVNGTAGVLANYDTPDLLDGTLTIGRAPLSIDADGKSKEYGEPDPSPLTYALHGFKNGENETTAGVAGTASCSLSGSAGPNVGSYTNAITCGVGTLAAANYEFVTGDKGTLAITKAQLKVNGDDASTEYGDAPVLKATLTGFKNNETKSSAGVTGVADCSVASGTSTHVGSYTDAVTCSSGTLAAANYKFDTGSKGRLDITKATLTINAQHASATLGAAPSLAYSLTGFKYAETTTSAGVTGAADCSVVAGTPTGVGSYASVITCAPGTLAAGDYKFVTGTKGNLTIVYKWDGFLQPINDTAHQVGVLESKFKLGSTVPVKFQIKNAGGTVVQQATAPTFQQGANRGPCDSTTSPEATYVDTPTPGTAFRWDSSLQGYIYNFSTKGLQNGEYRIYANLADGTKQYVDLCLTK
jgi:uncharacterized protein YaiE (UPF0345 family)